MRTPASAVRVYGPTFFQPVFLILASMAHDGVLSLPPEPPCPQGRRQVPPARRPLPAPRHVPPGLRPLGHRMPMGPSPPQQAPSAPVLAGTSGLRPISS